MGELERIDQLTAPPVVGRYYLVPTIRYIWDGRLKSWPIMGAKHTDEEFFSFKAPHYHVDRRCLPPGDSALVLREFGYASVAQAMPISAFEGDRLPAVVWRARKCRSAEIHFPTKPWQVVAMQTTLAGTQCKRGAAGWICPHRGFALGSIAPWDNGVITCPMHGLQIDAASGKVIPGARP